MTEKSTDEKFNYGCDLPENNTHPKTHKQKCNYFPNCKYGTNCKYIHPTKMCKYYPNCKYGDKCTYLHPIQQIHHQRNMTYRYMHTSNNRHLGTHSARVIPSNQNNNRQIKFAGPKNIIGGYGPYSNTHLYHLMVPNANNWNGWITL